jgi:hypothetical protein
MNFTSTQTSIDWSGNNLENEDHYLSSILDECVVQCSRIFDAMKQDELLGPPSQNDLTFSEYPERHQIHLQRLIVHDKDTTSLSLQSTERRSTVSQFSSFSTSTSDPPAKTFRHFGMILDGTVIDSMVVGGPAFNTGQLDRGDEILSINRETASEANLHVLLVGSDAPGSSVTVTVRKAAGGAIKDVVIPRMDTEVIADRCRLYELCAEIKVRSPAVISPPTPYSTRYAKISFDFIPNQLESGHLF